MLSCVKFPQISQEPVSFYKHPYKLFALTPVTFVLWKSVEIAGHEGVFGAKDATTLARITICFAVAATFHNLGCWILSSPFDSYCPRLKRAVFIMTGLFAVNFFDPMVPDMLDNELGQDALFIRVALVAATVLLSLILIRYANSDEPYLLMVGQESDEALMSIGRYGD